MEEHVRISLLLDIYGSLLTEKQNYIMNLYFNEDLSLFEISELTNTSRQAIYDIIKRCEKSINNYEDKLKIFERNVTINKIKDSIVNKLDSISNYTKDTAIISIVNQIKNDIDENI